VELGHDFPDAAVHDPSDDFVVPKLRIPHHRLRSGEAFGTNYVAVASLHAPQHEEGIEGVHFVAQVRLPVAGREGVGVWYTYDPIRGTCVLNAHGFHDDRMEGMQLCAFVREDAIEIEPVQHVEHVDVDLTAPVEETRCDLSDCFPVTVLQIANSSNACWLDTGIIAIFSALRFHGGKDCRLDNDRSVRRNERAFVVKSQEVWDSVVAGDASAAKKRDAFWNWMASDPSFHPIFESCGMPMPGAVGNPSKFLEVMITGCRCLALETRLWNEGCGVEKCRWGKRTGSRSTENSLLLETLPDPHSGRSARVDLCKVVDSLLKATGKNFYEFKDKRGHIRRRWHEPIAGTSDLPKCFVAFNLDIERNDLRRLKVDYDISDSAVIVRDSISYVASAVIMQLPEHFACQIRVECPSGVSDWWTFDGLRDAGRLTANQNGKFMRSPLVSAIVFSRMDGSLPAGSDESSHSEPAVVGTPLEPYHKVDIILARGMKDVERYYLVKWTDREVAESSFVSEAALEDPALIVEGLPLHDLDIDEPPEADSLKKLFEERQLECVLTGEAIAPPPDICLLKGDNATSFLDCSIVMVWCLRRHAAFSLLEDDEETRMSPITDGEDRELMASIVPDHIVEEGATFGKRWRLWQCLRALESSPMNAIRAEQMRNFFWMELRREYLQNKAKDEEACGRGEVVSTSRHVIPPPLRDGGLALSGMYIVFDLLDQAPFAHALMKRTSACSRCGTAESLERVSEMRIHLDPKGCVDDVLASVNRWLAEDLDRCTEHPRVVVKVHRACCGKPPVLLHVIFDRVDNVSRRSKESVGVPRVEIGVCFREDFEIIAFAGQRYIPIASLHEAADGCSVAQLRLRIPGRPGFGVWYTYDSNKGCCSVNPNGLHSRNAGSMLSCVFVKEGDISTSNTFCTPLASACPEDSLMESQTGHDDLGERFSVDTFSLKSDPESSWVDCGLVAMHAVFASRRLRCDVGAHLRIQYEEEFKSLEALWDAAATGECPGELHAEVLRAISNAISAFATASASRRSGGSAGFRQSPDGMLHFLVEVSGRLALSCADWMLPCETVGCFGSLRLWERQNDICMVDVPRLMEPSSAFPSASLNEVVASFFKKGALNFLGPRLSVIDSAKGPQFWSAPSSQRCLHPRGRWLCPVGSAADMPVAFVALNHDAECNKERSRKITYQVEDKPIELGDKGVRYVPSSVVTAQDEHYACQVRIESSKGSSEWWTYDGMANEGRFVKNDDGAFHGSESVSAVVFSRVDATL
jgi:hypothetical protein